jgi:hypothetical protein
MPWFRRFIRLFNVISRGPKDPRTPKPSPRSTLNPSCVPTQRPPLREPQLVVATSTANYLGIPSFLPSALCDLHHTLTAPLFAYPSYSISVSRTLACSSFFAGSTPPPPRHPRHQLQSFTIKQIIHSIPQYPTALQLHAAQLCATCPRRLAALRPVACLAAAKIK